MSEAAKQNLRDKYLARVEKAKLDALRDSRGKFDEARESRAADADEEEALFGKVVTPEYVKPPPVFTTEGPMGGGSAGVDPVTGVHFSSTTTGDPSPVLPGTITGTSRPTAVPSPEDLLAEWLATPGGLYCTDPRTPMDPIRRRCDLEDRVRRSFVAGVTAARGWKDLSP